MGGLFSCCRYPSGFEEVDSDGEEDPYARDVIIIRNMMSSAPSISLAMTISYPDGKVRAVVPEEFQPDLTCIKDIVSAFKGHTKGVAKRHIDLGPDAPRYYPGKMVDGRVLYCLGERQGGCVILRARACLLVAAYDGNVEASVRIAEDTAHYMIEYNL